MLETNGRSDKVGYNFDQVVDRRNTNSIKYDFALEKGKPEDVLPLWVADMDFRAPECVVEALLRSAEHGIFGYSETKEDYFKAIHNWYKTRFSWETKESWLVKTPGVVFAISVAIRALTEVKDAIMIQQPVYHPFHNAIINNKRELINSPLVYQEGKYHIDFDDFEKKIIKHKVKMFILCSPHNPVGRVWRQEELIGMGDICIKHNVIVVSDEIHGDFVYKGNRHHVFASLKAEYEKKTIVCTAPSKTFNLAGLQASNIFIPNKEMRERFKEEFQASGASHLNTMGIVACQAAYEEGAEWLDALLNYLEENLKMIRDFLAERLPQVRLVEPEGTYLIWLDFNQLGLSPEELEDLITNKAKLWFNRGEVFGEEGRGFQRVNIACPRLILGRMLIQLEEAIGML